jgi:predicted nucleic acid-binding protein
MIILDTNVVSEMMAPTPSAALKTWSDRLDPRQFWVTSVSRAELLYGVEIMPVGRRREALGLLIGRFFADTLKNEVLPFGARDAEHYASIAANRRKAGRPISTFDAQIAAVARSRGFGVATRNVRDFEECGVDVINPWQAAT